MSKTNAAVLGVVLVSLIAWQVVAQCGPPGPPGVGPPGGHMCLGLPCPRPPPECVFLEPTIVYQNGCPCPGCPNCITAQEACQQPPCLPPSPGCVEYEDTISIQYYKGNRVECPGCRNCVRFMCDDINCPPLPTTCVIERPQFIFVNGMQCPTCPLCVTAQDVCLGLPCAPPPRDCIEFEQTTVIQRHEGVDVKCPGCSICINPGPY